MTEYLTADAVRERLRKACARAGGVKSWARSANLSRTYVYGVIAGQYPPTQAICVAMKIEPIVMYRLDERENAA
jgi:hypothetical protein